MKKEIFHLKNNAARVVFSAMLLLIAVLQINAQSTNSPKAGDSSQIPPEFISSTTFSVDKLVNPVLVLNSSTPYFTEIDVVDGNIKLIENVIITDVKDADDHIVERGFNFSAVPPGTYYAKGVLTGTMVYYQIFLTD